MVCFACGKGVALAGSSGKLAEDLDTCDVVRVPFWNRCDSLEAADKEEISK